MTWMQTYSGKKFDLLDPQPEMVCLEDVAHSLARQCRYNGHTLAHYSVAEHSVIMSRLVPPEYALQALLHDAHEAYVGDVPRPLKRVLGETWDELEQHVWLTVAEHFGIDPVLNPIVHEYDRAICLAERKRFMSSQDLDWGIVDPFNIDHRMLCGLKAREAKAWFITRYGELTA